MKSPRCNQQSNGLQISGNVFSVVAYLGLFALIALTPGHAFRHIRHSNVVVPNYRSFLNTLRRMPRAAIQRHGAFTTTPLYYTNSPSRPNPLQQSRQSVISHESSLTLQPGLTNSTNTTTLKSNVTENESLLTTGTQDAWWKMSNLRGRLLSRKPQRSSTMTTQWTSQNLAIALPALMGLLADPVLSMVDTGFVGRIGPMELAALGVCTSIFHMFFSVFRASTVATTSLVASASSQAEKRHIAKISLQLAGILGTLVLAGLRFGGPTILATMGVSATSPLYKPACDYLFARCWAAPAVVGRKYLKSRV